MCSGRPSCSDLFPLVKCLLFAKIVSDVLITGVRPKTQVIDNELKESNEGVHIGVVGSLVNMVTSLLIATLAE